MVNLVLLGGKLLFLLFLYLFIFWVIRASMRDMRGAGAQAQRGPSGGAVRVTAAPLSAPVSFSGGAVTAGAPPAALSTRGTWALVVEESPHASQGWAFVVPLGVQMVAGRAEDADIHLPDTFVSSHHARIEARSDGLLVDDLRSTNGTFVNGEEISGPVVTGPGDQVAIGDSVFRVEER